MMDETSEIVGGGSEIAKRGARIDQWIAKGKPFEDWSVWLALDTYMILAEEYGWDSYTNTFKIYYNMA